MKTKTLVWAAIGSMAIIATTIGLAAATGDRLNAPVMVGQGQAVNEAISFDIGNGSSNATIQGTSTGNLGLLQNGSAPGPAAGASVFVSAKDSSPAFAIERTNSNTAAFSFTPHSNELDIVGMVSNTIGLRLTDSGSLTAFGNTSVQGNFGASGGAVLAGTLNIGGAATLNSTFFEDAAVAGTLADIDNTSSSGAAIGLLVSLPNSSSGTILELTGPGSTSTTTTSFIGDGSATIGNNLTVANGHMTISTGGGGNVPHACTIRSSSIGSSSGNVNCNAGEIATGGGCHDGGGGTISQTDPFSSPNWGWSCTTSGSTVVAYVVCCSY